MYIMLDILYIFYTIGELNAKWHFLPVNHSQYYERIRDPEKKVDKRAKYST